MSTLNMDFDKKKYIYMESILQQINQECISFSDELVRRNNPILKQIVEILTKKMKEVDPLFNLLFTTVFYGGSYFDGLKVGSPEEYDLDLLLELPKFSTPKVINSNVPGFMHIQLQKYEKFAKQPEFAKYKEKHQEMVEARNYRFQNRYNHNNTYNRKNYNKRYNNYNKTKLHLTKTQKLLIEWLIETGKEERRMSHRIRALLKLVDDKFYLLTTKVSRWIEGVITKALQNFPKENNYYVLEVPYGKLMASVHKGGPAFTLKITSLDLKIDVDFVPCFIFKNSWPEEGYRKNPSQTKLNFFVVPKHPKQEMPKKERYWRLSFQEQERVIINNYPRLKPALRLLKRLRDNLNHKFIASYYLKTLFLWEISEGNDDIFRYSLSYAFMKMLYILQSKIEKKEIPYFWNKKNNLIGNIKDITLIDAGHQLKNIIKVINNHPNEPRTINKYLGATLDFNMAGKIKLTI